SQDLGIEDFLSYKFYPKVFKDYFKNRQQWGDASIIPTIPFFYGLKPNEEIMVQIAKGKTLNVRYMFSTEPDEKGMRTVNFKLNGQTRAIEIKDKSVKTDLQQNKKAESEKEIGAPLPGLLSKIF